MSEYHYLSSSKSSQRAVKRMIGMQIFYHRHKYRIYAELLCEKAHITLRELENVELGDGKAFGAEMVYHQPDFKCA